MSNYVSQATSYAAKISGFKSSVSEINSSINSIASSLKNLNDCTLKSNVLSKTSQIKKKLDSIINEATGNVSKINAKAILLDEEEARLESLREKQKILSKKTKSNNSNIEVKKII